MKSFRINTFSLAKEVLLKILLKCVQQLDADVASLTTISVFMRHSSEAALNRIGEICLGSIQAICETLGIAIGDLLEGL